jgi:MFS transporter, Spinster family, sphingosine-1-phosphate transporter
MNMLDFLDRNLMMSMQPQIKAELAITNFQWGLLTSIFLVSYSFFGPIMGWLGDRFRRTWLLGVGVGVWSLAAIGSGLARGHGDLALARSALGIDEATYGVIAPTILLDLFVPEQRARLWSRIKKAESLTKRTEDHASDWIARFGSPAQVSG